MSKRIVFAVTNDLSFDQRMHRICGSLVEAGFSVLLIGRNRPHSLPLNRSYAFDQQRLSCWFDKGKLFYIEYNLRLFFYLFNTRADIYGAIDLDAALPLYAHAKRRKKPWTFDAHEYFSELEEVITRPAVHFVWKWVESFVVSRAKHAYTISIGYAKRFKSQYGTSFNVIRNVPSRHHSALSAESTDVPIIIYQGALNVGRGLEEAIEAMCQLDGVELHIYGDGPIKQQLIDLIQSNHVEDKVKLKGACIPENLRAITPSASIGLTLFSAHGFHHQYSLANRFFDYIHAGIPQICMSYPEYHTFNKTHEVAVELDVLSSDTVAGAIRQLLDHPKRYIEIQANTSAAAAIHNWENEAERLIDIYKDL